ncbi:unnamed protein product [Closterium sp. Yama58-4]|nr:unnamed protein product [Closterium sp. Yama58-4]
MTGTGAAIVTGITTTDGAPVSGGRGVRRRRRSSLIWRETFALSSPIRCSAHTLLAYQINLKADERDVYEFFSQAGKVRDVRLIMDRYSRRSKGVGYIEFYDPMAVPMALALSGQLLLGTPVMVKPSEAEKNLAAAQSAASAAAAGGAGLLATGSKRLHVGNLHVNMNEGQLRQVFEPFGELESVEVPMEPGSAQCKGFGFVQYARLEDARMAHQNLEGLELAGLAIKITPVPEVMEPVAPGELIDERGGLALDAQTRAALMLKLDRTGTSAAAAAAVVPGAGVLAANPLAAMALRPGMLPTVPVAAAAAAPAPAVEIGTPSEFILLTNMFDSSEKVDDEFEQDVQDDVFEECSKFGAVKKVRVDRASEGHVYVQFETVAAASAARTALHNRYFGGKPICATFVEASKTKTAVNGQVILTFLTECQAAWKRSLSGWDSTSNCSDAVFVTCDQDGMLTTMFLADQLLTGFLPSSVGAATRLNPASIGSRIYSPHPCSLPCALSDISDNKFSGGLPTSIGKLSLLTLLNARENALQGSIPATLGSLDHITTIQLGGNNLTGSIPASFSNLVNLHYLCVAPPPSAPPPSAPPPSAPPPSAPPPSAPLPSAPPPSAPLPSAPPPFAPLPSAPPSTPPPSAPRPSAPPLSTPPLSASPIPLLRPTVLLPCLPLPHPLLLLVSSHLLPSLSIQQQGNETLCEIAIQYNQFTGSIPSDIGLLQSLSHFDISSNKLTGAIPTTIGNLVNLTTFNVSHNKFTGYLPASMISLTTLDYLDYTQDPPGMVTCPPSNWRQCAALTSNNIAVKYCFECADFCVNCSLLIIRPPTVSPSPAPSSSAAPLPPSPSSSGLSVGAIAGIAVAGQVSTRLKSLEAPQKLLNLLQRLQVLA